MTNSRWVTERVDRQDLEALLETVDDVALALADLTWPPDSLPSRREINISLSAAALLLRQACIPFRRDGVWKEG